MGPGLFRKPAPGPGPRPGRKPGFLTGNEACGTSLRLGKVPRDWGTCTRDWGTCPRDWGTYAPSRTGPREDQVAPGGLPGALLGQRALPATLRECV